MDREEYMSAALTLAREAFDEGEIPVGCVITDAQGNIIGRGRNKREESHDATHHAEMEAIREACRTVGDWRLTGCTIYVTLEPCPMCAGGIINSRIPTVVSARRMKTPAHAAASSICLRSATGTSRPSTAECEPRSRRNY